MFDLLIIQLIDRFEDKYILFALRTSFIEYFNDNKIILNLLQFICYTKIMYNIKVMAEVYLVMLAYIIKSVITLTVT